VCVCVDVSVIEGDSGQRAGGPPHRSVPFLRGHDALAVSFLPHTQPAPLLSEPSLRRGAPLLAWRVRLFSLSIGVASCGVSRLPGADELAHRVRQSLGTSGRSAPRTVCARVLRAVNFRSCAVGCASGCLAILRPRLDLWLDACLCDEGGHRGACVGDRRG
jgi:hypothetical protein